MAAAKLRLSTQVCPGLRLRSSTQALASAVLRWRREERPLAAMRQAAGELRLMPQVCSGLRGPSAIESTANSVLPWTALYVRQPGLTIFALRPLLTRNGEFDRYLTPGLQGRSTRYCHAAFTQVHHLTTNLRLVRFADRRRDRDRATKVAQALTNNQSIGSLQGAANRAG